MSTSSILPVEGDPDTVLLPLPDSPPPAAFHNNPNEGHQGTTTNLAIQCVQVNKNQAITHMDDRLDETNWTICVTILSIFAILSNFAIICFVIFLSLIF